MKKYKFRLDSLLKVYKIKELQALNDFFKQKTIINLTQQEKEKLELEQQKCLTDLSEKKPRYLYVEYLSTLKKKADSLDKELWSQREKLKVIQIELKKKMQKRKMVEKIKGKE